MGIAPRRLRTMSITFALFWVTFGAFVLDVLLGKYGVISGGEVNQYLGYVSHFLLLALSAVLLTVECLRRETRRNDAHERADIPVQPKTPTN
jgi:hypothetical protein